MPIDPSIPLGVRPPEALNPLAILGQVQGMREMQAQAEDRRLAREDRAKERELRLGDIRRADQVRAVFAKTPRAADGSLDYNALSRELMLVDPDAAMKAEDRGRSIAAAAVTTKLNELKLWSEKLQTASQIARTMTPENFAGGKATIASLVGEEIAQHLGETYDPAIIRQAIDWGLTNQQRIDQEHKRLELEAQTARDAAAAADRAKDDSRADRQLDFQISSGKADDARADRALGESMRSNRAREANDAADRAARNTTTKDGDDPTLPLGVKRYIADMHRRGYTREQAAAEFAKTPQYETHKKLDAVKVKKAFDEFWPAPKVPNDPFRHAEAGAGRASL
jgi:hypothetical protein